MEIRPDVFTKDNVDDLLEELADVVLQREAMIGVRRDSPVDHVDIEALFQISLDDALVWLKVEDVVPVDEGVAEHYRFGIERWRLPPVTKKPELALFEHHVVR